MAKVDLSQARELYPSCGMGTEEWNAFFATSDGLRSFGRIIYDIYDEVMSQQERAAGIRRVGRRPARSAVSLDRVFDTILPPDFNNEPLSVVLPPLIGSRGIKEIAEKAHMSRSHLSWILSGRRQPTLEGLEALADVLGVQPWYFIEWRAQYLSALVLEVLMASPRLGTSILRDLRTGRRRQEVSA
jgi:DNA-binding phage protein